jgi:hypothetical protein
MAKFVSLTRDGTGETVHVNMDHVAMLVHHESRHTIVTFADNALANLTVRQSPPQILEQALGEDSY